MAAVMAVKGAVDFISSWVDSTRVPRSLGVGKWGSTAGFAAGYHYFQFIFAVGKYEIPAFVPQIFCLQSKKADSYTREKYRHNSVSGIEHE